MSAALGVILFLMGTAFGSFLNVVIDRLPAGKSLAFPPSHCDGCGRRLSPGELIPILSYLWLRGRCSACGDGIPLRVLWVELGTGLLFVLNYRLLGLTVDFARITFYCLLFLVIGVIDLKHKLILNKLVYPAALVALVMDLFTPGIGWANGLIGAGIGFVFLLVPAVINPRGMGFGDVKMAGLMGLVTGFPMIFVALLVGIILGGLVAIFLLIFGKKKRKETIAFGPFLSLGTIIALLAGNPLLDWYLGLF